MTRRPDLFLISVAFDPHGVHGHLYFRDPMGPELRRVTVHGVGDVDQYRLEPAHGDPRDGWEAYLTEASRLVALIRPDTAEEHN